MEPVGVKLVLVTWHDAWFDFDQPDEGHHDDYLVRTVGYVVREGDRYLSIAQELLPHDDGFRAITHIPFRVIESVEPIESLDRSDPVRIKAEDVHTDDVTSDGRRLAAR